MLKNVFSIEKLSEDILNKDRIYPKVLGRPGTFVIDTFKKYSKAVFSNSINYKILQIQIKHEDGLP